MHYNTVILGAGAAGMMCAAHSGGSVLLVDHARAPGEKIRISGGGRCNFTNMHCSPGAFISRNPHFAKSALAKYTQWDFIALVDAHAIAWHEKTLGQLFCDTSAKLIIAMLRDLMQNAGVELRLQSTVEQIEKTDSGYSMSLITPQGATTVTANQLVIASGGKSIPKMGATGCTLCPNLGHRRTGSCDCGGYLLRRSHSIYAPRPFRSCNTPSLKLLDARYRHIYQSVVGR